MLCFELQLHDCIHPKINNNNICGLAFTIYVYVSEVSFNCYFLFQLCIRNSIIIFKKINAEVLMLQMQHTIQNPSLKNMSNDYASIDIMECNKFVMRVQFLSRLMLWVTLATLNKQAS